MGLVLLAPLVLLSACGRHVLEDRLPDVPLAVRPAQPNCRASVQGLAGLVGLAKLSGQNVLTPATLRAQNHSPDNLYNLLLTARRALNGYYYGFSGVDLQALHRKYETLFRAGQDRPLSLYGIDAGTDARMAAYFAEVGDGHTYYLDEAQARTYRDVQAGNPTPQPVFGLSFAPLPGTDGAVVLSVRGDGPAFAAGLRRGDVLRRVNGEAFDRNGADEAAARTAYSALLARAAAGGSAAHFQYDRAGSPNSAFIQARVLSAGQLPYGEFLPNGVYYLRLPSFSGAGVADRVHALVGAAKRGEAQGVILDLRDNGGGRVVEFVGAAAAFAPDFAGEVLEDNTANDVTFRYDGASGSVVGSDVCGSQRFSQSVTSPQTWTGPTAILVNARSASASELFAQALRLGGKARVIGEDTYGVGNTVTYIFTDGVPGARAMSVTAGRGRLLNGRYAQEQVKPDDAQSDDLARLAQGEDLALNAARAYLEGAARTTAAPRVP